MKHLALFLFFFLSYSISLSAEEPSGGNRSDGEKSKSEKKLRPYNVVVLISDDQRSDTIAEWGNKEIKTPALDRLAREGFSFRECHCMGGMHGAVCVPARAMFLSGRSLFRIDEKLDKHAIWPESFSAQGYQTFATGKWHNGNKSLLRSFQGGKGLFLGGMGNPYKLPMQDMIDKELQPAEHPPEQHAVEIIADSAIRFLKEEGKQKPFLLYVALEAPHDPRIAPEKFQKMYRDPLPSLPPNFLPKHPFNNGEMKVRDEQLAASPRRKEEIRRHLADYYGYITYMDEQIGRILQTLEDEKLNENTYVLFLSDQGLSIGSHGLMGKQNLYEEAMRIPCILRGPQIPRNASSEALVYAFDLFATLGELTGVAAPSGNEGKSLLPLLESKESTIHETLFTAYRQVQRAVRDPRWKYIYYPQNGEEQLFDLLNDPHEIKNLASVQGEKKEEMRKKLSAAQHYYSDPLLKKQEGDAEKKSRPTDGER